MSINLPSLHRLRLWLCVTLMLAATPVYATVLPSEIPSTPIEEWEAQKGDFFIVDTVKNMGYLLHTDGGFTSFILATGQKRVVRYIGRTYNAKTPDKSWTSLSLEKKGDRITFGPTGRFLRLTDNKDNERTPYGIHSHAYVARMMEDTERYKSMGCIIVTEEMMDLLIATFEMNNERLSVITVGGFAEDYVSEPTLRDLIAEKAKKSAVSTVDTAG